MQRVVSSRILSSVHRCVPMLMRPKGRNRNINLIQTIMEIIFTVEDILNISQNHIDGNLDLFTKGLSEEDAKQLLQSIKSTIEQEVSNIVNESVYDDLMVINDQN